VDDSVITAKVKKARLDDKEVKSFDVGVETTKGVVQLSGFVNTSDQKYSAGQDASEVPGVKDVKNSLIIK
jgi:osmotically-inducible protein OsmY